MNQLFCRTMVNAVSGSSHRCTSIVPANWYYCNTIIEEAVNSSALRRETCHGGRGSRAAGSWHFVRCNPATWALATGIHECGL